jgi:hypothetical protein
MRSLAMPWRVLTGASFLSEKGIPGEQRPTDMYGRALSVLSLLPFAQYSLLPCWNGASGVSGIPLAIKRQECRSELEGLQLLSDLIDTRLADFLPFGMPFRFSARQQE